VWQEVLDLPAVWQSALGLQAELGQVVSVRWQAVVVEALSEL